jgi:hypothetical protein
MSIGEDQVARALRPWLGRGLRISILGMLALVAAAAAAMVVYRRVSQRVFERPSLFANYDKTAPAADGVIAPKEYGPVVWIQWTRGNTLTAFRRELHDPTTSPIPLFRPQECLELRHQAGEAVALPVTAARSSPRAFFKWVQRRDTSDISIEDPMAPRTPPAPAGDRAPNPASPVGHDEDPGHAIAPRQVFGAADDRRGDLRRRPLGGVRGRASMGTQSPPAGSSQSADREASWSMAVEQPISATG